MITNKIIVFAPYSKPRTDGKTNSKDYSYWQEVIDELAKDYSIWQVVYGEEIPIFASDTNLKKNVTAVYPENFQEIEAMLRTADTFLCVDNYLQHMGHFMGKRGVAVYGPSDPKLFGYADNTNLFADEKYFRPWQFQTWNEWDFNADAFVKPQIVIDAVRSKLES